MQSDFPAFCYHQSAKMTEYARNCTDLVLKDELLQMSASWLKILSGQHWVTKKSIFESTTSARHQGGAAYARP